MKKLLLIVSIFVFEGVALWGLGEKTALRSRYDRFMNYPVGQKSALGISGSTIAENVINNFPAIR